MKPATVRVKGDSGPTARELAGKFLDHCKDDLADETYDFYRRYVVLFVKSIGDLEAAVRTEIIAVKEDETILSSIEDRRFRDFVTVLDPP